VYIINYFGSDSQTGTPERYARPVILPMDWDIGITNEVGSATLSNKDRTVSKEECDELCTLIRALKVKVDVTGVDTNTVATGLQGSLRGLHQ
jgi:hypothetical protein